MNFPNRQQQNSYESSFEARPILAESIDTIESRQSAEERTLLAAMIRDRVSNRVLHEHECKERWTFRLEADLYKVFKGWAQQVDVKVVHLFRVLLDYCEPLILISMPEDPYESKHPRAGGPQASFVPLASKADQNDAAVLRKSIEHVLLFKGRNPSSKEIHVNLQPRFLNLIGMAAFRYRTTPTQFVQALIQVVMRQFQSDPTIGKPSVQQ